MTNSIRRSTLLGAVRALGGNPDDISEIHILSDKITVVEFIHDGDGNRIADEHGAGFMKRAVNILVRDDKEYDDEKAALAELAAETDGQEN